MSSQLTIFTTSWCGFCARLKRGLDTAGIGFTEVDIEADQQAADTVAGINQGNHTVPTLQFADGSSLTNPSVADVERKLAALS